MDNRDLAAADTGGDSGPFDLHALENNRAGPGLSSTNDSAFNHPQELLGIRDLDFDTIYARTGHLLNAGDWLGAIKYLYVAAILWLDRKGLIAFRSSKTNMDYIRELKARTRVQDMFRQLTFCFEPIVYGGQTATKSTANDMAGTVRRIIHEPTTRYHELIDC